jgi:hypothetical protein
MHGRPIWCELPWWTETNAVWVQAFGLILAFLLQLYLLYLTLREQKAARLERRHDEVRRQRSDVTCAGITSILRTLPEDQLCIHLWAGHFRRAGFAFDKTLYGQLPEYLRRKSDSFMEDIKKPISIQENQTARFLLVFIFPYPKFDAVLEDVNRLHFGNVHLVWDDDGKPISVPRY